MERPLNRLFRKKKKHFLRGFAAAYFPFVNGCCHFSERSLPFETVDAIYCMNPGITVYANLVFLRFFAGAPAWLFHTDDHTLLNYDMTPGFKPFTILLHVHVVCIIITSEEFCEQDNRPLHCSLGY